MPEHNLLTKIDITRSRIIRALMCAAGLHEVWEQTNVWNGGTDVVRMAIQSDMHDRVFCAVCKHCRTIYVRRRNE